MSKKKGHGKQASVSAKLANMAKEARTRTGKSDDSPITKSDLETLLNDQRESFKTDVASLIKEATESLKSSVGSLRQEVSSVNGRLTQTEVLVGENFEKIAEMETAIKTLQKQCTKLQDKVDDLENRSRRSNLRIINVPEGCEKGQDPAKFVSDLLMEVTGSDVFSSPPEIERAHRTRRRSEVQDKEKPRAFLVKFLRFQEKENMLTWAKNNQITYRDSELRIYSDMSADLAKRRAAFNDVKAALYRRKIKFQLRHPARLYVSFQDQDYFFDTPQEAKDFYDQQINVS